MSRLSLSNAALQMSYKVNAKEVDKMIDRLDIEPSGNLDVVSTDAVAVAALQVLAKPYDSLADYIVDMNVYIADAVNRRAQLICFPAYAGLLPVAIPPQVRQVLPHLTGEEPGEVDALALYELLSYCADYAFESYSLTMSALAARYGVYIMAGSTLCFDGDDLRHRALLFNDAGELAGFQDKLSLSEFEQTLQLQPASEVKLFDTRLGPLSILIGSDTRYYEPARIAAGLGAQMLLCPGCYTGEFTPVDSSIGLNMRCQENMLYGIQSSLVGEALGLSLEGGGRIFVPNQMLRHKNGVAAATNGRHEPDVALLPLNLDKLDELENPYTKDRNREFLDRFIDRLY